MLLTLIATAMKSSNASRFCGSSMESVCSGGVRNQLSKSADAAAVTTAGQKPPTTETRNDDKEIQQQVVGQRELSGGR